MTSAAAKAGSPHGTSSVLLPVLLVDAFTSVPGQGNRAGVVLDGTGLSVNKMQSIARALAVSETAFVFPSDRAAYQLRFFSPTAEIDFCGHASLATMHALSERESLPENFDFECQLGTIAVEIEKGVQSASTKIWLRPLMARFEPSPVPEREVLDALGIAVACRESALPIEKNAHRLIIALRSRKDLFALQPSWEKLLRIGQQVGISGFHVFTQDVMEFGSAAHSRYFAPGHGVNEDPVTGSAAVGLAGYLVRHRLLIFPKRGGENIVARFEQGDVLGKTGRIDVTVIGNSAKIEAIQISGQAVTVLQGQLTNS